MPPENNTPPSNSRSVLIGVGIVALIIVIAVVAYALYTQQQVADQMPVAETPGTPVVPPPPPPPAVAPSESLGGSLYEKSQNPLEDKLPDQSPVANPINDAYKNPFE
jgi:hypothetical protein